jgi:hypothetical protein
MGWVLGEGGGGEQKGRGEREGAGKRMQVDDRFRARIARHFCSKASQNKAGWCLTSRYGDCPKGVRLCESSWCFL